MQVWLHRFLSSLPLLVALLLCLRQMAVYADSMTDRHALDAPLIQDQQQPLRLNQDEVQRQAGAAALSAKGNKLIHQCWSLVEKQAKYPGSIGFQSARIEDNDRLGIRGKVSLQDGKGHSVTFDYFCRMDSGRQFFDSVEVTESEDDETTP